MGNSQSAQAAAPLSSSSAGSQASSLAGNLAGGCPVVGPQQQSAGSETAGAANQQPECPAKQTQAGYRNPAVYNVYGQRINDPTVPQPENPLVNLKNTDVIDPRNNMPLEANQMPCPGQRKPLSTARALSTIPKGGTDSAWLFPSPQMVYNALKRKGKGDDVTEDDMDGFVAAHNAMNEATWQQVALWEKLHAQECNCPQLLRFQGKPHDLSPLAWLRTFLGGPLPFDRHDWVVDRCGKDVRYVIDFYFNEDKAGTPQAFDIVTRPALDSMEAALDRIKMSIYLNFAQWGLPCPITGQAGTIAQAAAASTPSGVATAQQ